MKKKPMIIAFSKTAILAIAEIKAAVEAFDRGETNVFDAVDAVLVVVDAYRASRAEEVRRRPSGRDAA